MRFPISEKMREKLSIVQRMRIVLLGLHYCCVLIIGQSVKHRSFTAAGFYSSNTLRRGKSRKQGSRAGEMAKVLRTRREGIDGVMYGEGGN